MSARDLVLSEDEARAIELLSRIRARFLAPPPRVNTGDGVMGAVTAAAGIKAGVYVLTVIEPAAGAGAFMVEDPDGVTIGTGNVAAAFEASGLSFTLADGATDRTADRQAGAQRGQPLPPYRQAHGPVRLQRCRLVRTPARRHAGMVRSGGHWRTRIGRGAAGSMK